MEKSFLELVYYSMLAVAKCDGNLSDSEVHVLRDYIISHDLTGVEDPSTNDCLSELKLHQIINNAAENCDTDRKRFHLINRISQITDADGEYHPSEAEVLNILHKRWDVDIALSSAKHTWTASQNKIISSSSSERILVDAPPGAGKTAIISARIDHLINTQDVNPSNIWLISFTRTAVREMRDRINLYSSDYPHGLRIATLDSAVFSMNFSLQSNDIEIFDNYDINIDSFIQLLGENNDDLLDFIDGLDHLIIDEAQDLVGNRKNLCVSLINCLQNNCGVTILGDEYQQIYGAWSNDNLKGDTTSLQQIIEQQPDTNNFQRQELSQIHRTDSPELLSLIEDLRLDLAVYDKSAKEDFDRRKQLLQERMGDVCREDMAKSVAGNCLILFRSRAAVLTSAVRLNILGRPFRLRIPGFPRYLLSWINSLFEYAHNMGITEISADDFEGIRSQFIARDIRSIKNNPIWKYLKEVASDDGNVSISKLREKLGKHGTRCMEFQSPDFGCIGPIISTVHSSKGRQAERVYFELHNINYFKNCDYGEESRVLFVGASRAKSTLNLIKQGDEPFSQDWIVARKYPKRRFRLYKDPNPKYHKTPMCFAEIGLDNDYDPYSIIKNNHSIDDVRAAQKFLKSYWPLNSKGICYATRKSLGTDYAVYYENSDKKIWLGEFSDQLHDALTTASYEVFRFNHYPPKRIPLKIIDVATYVATKDDPRLDSCLNAFKERGSWLYPVLFGIGPMFYSRNS